MKKIILSTIYALISLSCNAQIYTSVKYLDKFDDAIKVEQRKSLISKTDSTFVIEEKGKKPVVYYIINSVSSGTRGSKDDVVNLVGNVYGYEETWCVVRSDMYDNFLKANIKYIQETTEENLNDVGKYWLFAVHRTITTQFSASYIDDIFWLQDDLNDDKLGNGVNRIVYSK